MSHYFTRIVSLQLRSQSRNLPLLFKERNIYNNTSKFRLCSNVPEKHKQGWSSVRNIVVKFIPLGICLIAVMQWRAYRKYSDSRTAKNWEISCYCALPLRPLSRFWGWIADKQLPENLRPLIYGWYSTTFGVNIKEAISEDLKSYPSLGDFFARALKKGARKVEKSNCLVSPCDGKVLSYGIVKNGCIEQVKGVNYSLEDFLGYDEDANELNNINHKNKSKNLLDCRKKFLKNTDNSTTLYQCVLYLAPGDYHRFHSPTEWQPEVRKHFTGKLLSVNPTIASWIPGLFCLNERVSYLGNWIHGFFSYTAVGATNVGSVRVYFDESLRTNRPTLKKYVENKILPTDLSLRRGDCIGEFRMGSTIVLIFEAPKTFQFSLTVGQRVFMGQAIGHLATKQKHVDFVNKEEIKGVVQAVMH